MIGEAVRVGKDATTNHETIDFGILIVELKGMSAVFDIAVDNEFGLGANIITEFDDVRD